jgi:RNA methyltransferase, TrmH family
MAEPVGLHHPTMQRLRRLSRRRSARRDEGCFVIDGPTLLADALDAGVTVEAVVAEPGCPPALLDRAGVAGAAVHHADPGSLARVVAAVTPQPVVAVARIDEPALPAVAAAAGPLALVLVGVTDPGNAGTLMRSAEAAGAGAVLFCDGSVDPYGPKCVRSSAGSLFRLAVARATTAPEALAALGAAGLVTVATAARGASAYDAADLARPVAFVLGGEAHGLPAAVAAATDAAVTIPMAGRTESLNVGMAGTILCFEALRQRRNRLDATPPRAAGCTTT